MLHFWCKYQLRLMFMNALNFMWEIDDKIKHRFIQKSSDY